MTALATNAFTAMRKKLSVLVILVKTVMKKNLSASVRVMVNYAALGDLLRNAL